MSEALEQSPPARPLLSLVVVVAIGCAYVALFPDRTDYVGHFLAGAGGTYVVLSVVVSAFPGRPWWVVLGSVGAILLGVVTEATVFRLAELDPSTWPTRAWAPCWRGSACSTPSPASPPTHPPSWEGVALLVVGFACAFA